jgi:hypothetical protein
MPPALLARLGVSNAHDITTITKKEANNYEISHTTQTSEAQTSAALPSANAAPADAASAVPQASVASEARNTFLVSMAGMLRRQGLNVAEIRAALLSINEQRYSQGRHPQGPLSLEELERTVFKSLEKWQAGTTDTRFADRELKKLSTLLATTLTPRRWIVPGLFPEGLVLLVGDPKAGKSFLILNVALAVESGTLALGKIAVEPQAVLYMGLEDDAQRLQERARTMLKGREVSDRFNYELEWAILSNGGLDALRARLELHPEIQLVLIDTLAKVRGAQGSSGNVYQDDYALMGALQKLALEFHIALVLVYHTKKLGSTDPFLQVSGSRGMTGAADTLMVLKRVLNTPNATLHVTGRDVENQALTFDENTQSWLLTELA